MTAKSSMFYSAVMFIITVSVSLGAHADSADSDPADYDADTALQLSQAAIGRTLGDYAFTDRYGQSIRLTDFAGKPLLISLIYTSCYHTCPFTTRHLAKAVAKARRALGEDSFTVVTIGFDSAVDTPERMRNFAREQDVDASGWKFLSASPETIAALIEDLGFIYFASPRGFGHIVQATVIDRDSQVYAQVYGETFELPWLVEPLKELVFNRPQSAGHPIASFIDRLKIFCTVYDPNSGRYRIDYSLFVQFAVGLLIVVSVGAYLVTESRRARRRN